MKSITRGYASVSVVSLLLLSACGGGSTSVSDTLGAAAGDVDTAIDANVPAAVTAPDVTNAVVDLETGRFVDSAVIGLSYETATQSGVTGSDGTFEYAPGETIVFSIGDVELPAVSGDDLITPLTVFNTDEITDIRVMNLARLLQTLDVDGNAENGITISNQAIASGAGLSLDFASATFDSDAVNLVANSGSSQTDLVEGMPALEHLQATLLDEGVIELPEAIPVAVAPDPNAGATHPLVGTSHELVGFTHDVAGTVTILDDRTIEVSNFIFDGGGVDVFFYTSMNDSFFPAAGGAAIGPQLFGRPQNGGTVTLTLPDGSTLDDVDGLSVWCVPFNVSFGEVFF